MVMLDGICYRLRTDGTVTTMPASTHIPFADVTTFTPDLTLTMTTPMTLDQLEAAIDKALPSLNRFYAISITGEFSTLRARSVPAQRQPYPPLTSVVKAQAVFEMKDVAGTMVAFRCPAFASGIAVTGYHLHFLRADRQAGGHVLDCRLKSAIVRIAQLSTFQLTLPDDQVFNTADLTTSTPADVRKVER
jgi:acetolactate decarboxylase